MSFREAFGEFDGRAWLNCSHQGALPLAAAEAARQAIEWKVSPVRMTAERFAQVPERLRRRLARLIDAPVDEVLLSNGASRGLHLVANGLPLAAGDEVLLMAGDFPSNILPWLALRDRGVQVKIVEPAADVLTVDEIASAVTTTTRALCMSWVHSFSGRVADLDAIGSLCRERGIVFVANTTQGLGGCTLSVRSTPVDVVVNAGWKWLCGPYATGFCWMRAEVRERLEGNQAYWLARLTANDLESPSLQLEPMPASHPRRFDLFAPANFFNFVPWAESIGLILDSDPARVAAWDQGLVDRLLDGLAGSRWTVTSPTERPLRSTLVFVDGGNRDQNAEAKRRLDAAGVDVALRRGRLRIAPHFYNTDADIDRALDVLVG